MEEIINIAIGIFGLVFALIIAPLMRTKREKVLQSTPPEVAPPAEPQKTAQKRPLQRPTQRKKGSMHRLHPDSQEVIYRTEGEWSTGEAKKGGGHTILLEEEGAKNEAKHPEMEDFSLRKAVIWSEILKPKFEEED